ncbi:Mra1p PWA37_002604 [Arxiozyma heterogenica]
MAISVALCSGSYFTYKKLTTDKSLRLITNPEQSALEDVLQQKENNDN